MSNAVWLGLAIAAAIAVYIVTVGIRPNRMKKALAQARDSGELQPVVDAINAVQAAKQPTAWNQTIDKLWRSYERELAARLVYEAAQEHGAEDIIQYWIRHVLEVEPEIARKAFPKKFVAKFIKALQAQAEAQEGPKEAK